MSIEEDVKSPTEDARISPVSKKLRLEDQSMPNVSGARTKQTKKGGAPKMNPNKRRVKNTVTTAILDDTSCEEVHDIYYTVNFF